MINRKLVLRAIGASLGLWLSLMSVRAFAHGQATSYRTTYLTFSGAVTLPGVGLGAGTYVFELADPASNLDLVRITNMRRDRVVYTGFTRPVARPSELPEDRQIVIGEPTEGSAPPIKAWFPAHESGGHEFIYH